MKGRPSACCSLRQKEEEVSPDNLEDEREEKKDRLLFHFLPFQRGRRGRKKKRENSTPSGSKKKGCWIMNIMVGKERETPQ